MKCVLCGSKKSETVFPAVKGYGTDKKYSIVRCSQCGLSRTSPMPSVADLSEYYSHQKIAVNGIGSQDILKDYMDNRKQQWDMFGYDRRLAQIKQQAPRAKKVLDIGCGAGFFIDSLQANGYETYGIEFSDWGQKAAKKIGVKVTGKEIDKLPKNFPKEYDVITLFDVLEHTLNPVEFMTHVNDHLSKKGVVIVNCPNSASFMARVTKHNWNKLIPPNHTYHFNTKTLRKTIEEAGLDIVSVTTNSGDSKEFSRELSVAPWSYIGKAVPAARRAYDHKDLPLNESPHRTTTAAIKATQKLAERVPFAAKPVMRLMNALDKGEGVRVIARKKR